MKTEEQIQTLADKAAYEENKPTRKRGGMTYEQGVRNALDWVLEDESENDPLE